MPQTGMSSAPFTEYYLVRYKIDRQDGFSKSSRLNRHLIRSLGVVFVSIMLSVIITAVMMKVLIGHVAMIGITISICVPLVVALPINLFMAFQRRKLDRALAELHQSHLELGRLNEELQSQARYDYLTGVMNRRHMFETIAQDWDRDLSGALFFIDVDDFKLVNDSYGHQVGDEALKLVADIISWTMDDLDLVARMGGEEFAVFIRGTSYEKAARLSEKLRNTIEATPFTPKGGIDTRLSISLGVAFTSEARDLDQLIDLADARMYDAKRRGKNRVVLPAKETQVDVA